MNTRTQNTAVLITASFSSLLFTVSAGATAANHKIVNVKTDNSIEAAAPQGRYLIASRKVCKVKDPKPPLNVRQSPNGKIIGKLRNGTQVEAGLSQLDNKKKQWINIRSGNLNGWVIASSISNCSVTP